MSADPLDDDYLDPTIINETFPKELSSKLLVMEDVDRDYLLRPEKAVWPISSSEKKDINGKEVAAHRRAMAAHKVKQTFRLITFWLLAFVVEALMVTAIALIGGATISHLSQEIIQDQSVPIVTIKAGTVLVLVVQFLVLITSRATSGGTEGKSVSWFFTHYQDFDDDVWKSMFVSLVGLAVVRIIIVLGAAFVLVALANIIVTY